MTRRNGREIPVLVQRIAAEFAVLYVVGIYQRVKTRYIRKLAAVKPALQIEFRLRMPPRKLRKAVKKMRSRADRADVQPVIVAACHHAQVSLRRVELAEHFFAAFEKALTGGVEPKPLPAAVKQRRAQLTLELRYAF